IPRRFRPPTRCCAMSTTTCSLRRRGRGLVMLAGLGLLAACASPEPIDDWSATLPPASPAPDPVQANGAIYQTGNNIALFEDVKARRVGDTITVQLVERTNATTSSSTSTQKDTTADISNPTVF